MHPKWRLHDFRFLPLQIVQCARVDRQLWDFTPGKLRENGFGCWNAALWNSIVSVLVFLKQVRLQVPALLSNVLTNRSEIGYRRHDDSHGFANNFSVHLVVASPHLNDEIPHRLWRNYSLTIEWHDKASATIHIDDSSFILKKRV